MASIEKICPNCHSEKIERKDDSKWLLSPRDEKELRELFVPTKYYFVLFEFVDISKADDIDVSIFEVNPRTLGFSLCMIDYYFHIRANSKSKAPFNLWPDSPKLYMMKPVVIYKAIIRSTDAVDTVIFPGIDPPRLFRFDDLSKYAQTDLLENETTVDALAEKMKVRFPKEFPSGKGKKIKAKLAILQDHRERNKWDDEVLADNLARIFYGDKFHDLTKWAREFAPTL